MKRLETVSNIMSCLDAPIFKNRFDVFYYEDIDSLSILARDCESMELLCMYAHFESNPAPAEIQAIFDTPENKVVFIKGSDIDSFANSLSDFFMILRFFVE